jgi:Asp-tRNA(Asn)/Glu-tRNA(Gln) amidotransferase A subunit family amidase
MKNRLLLLMLCCGFLLGAFTYAVIEKISRENVQHASKIFGLEFTDAEIDSLLPDLEDRRNNYNSLRELKTPNSLSPALIFNPLPPGYQLDFNQKPIKFSKLPKVTLPANREELAFYSVHELAYLIKSKQISSVELTRFFLDRLKKYNEKLLCVVTFTEELAVEQAKRADAEIKAGKYRGMLHGIPYGAKDLFAVKGYKTTWGTSPFKDQTFDENAWVIQRLEQAGAVLIAKTTLGALASGDVWFGGRTRNPWNLEQGSSGSSAGSASAVSAGCMPFAIGTETLGSIVSPSTVCGTTGLRPTFGRISRTGAMALSWSMDKIGPIARYVEDCAIIFEVIRGGDGRDLSVVNPAFNYNPAQDIRKLRIGYVKGDFEGNYPFKQQDSASLLVVRALGVELVPIELPKLPPIRFILHAEAAAAFDELTRSGKDDTMERQTRGAWPNLFRAARFIPAVEYIQANRLRTQLLMDMNEVFKKVDIYVSPSWGSSSLTITNFTGHPAVVLPNGFRNGTPTSITFTGKLFGEADLMVLAKRFQDATEFHKKHPGM